MKSYPHIPLKYVDNFSCLLQDIPSLSRFLVHLHPALWGKGEKAGTPRAPAGGFAPAPPFLKDSLDSALG